MTTCSHGWRICWKTCMTAVALATFRGTWLNPTVCNQTTHRRNPLALFRKPASFGLNQKPVKLWQLTLSSPRGSSPRNGVFSIQRYLLIAQWPHCISLIKSPQEIRQIASYNHVFPWGEKKLWKYGFILMSWRCIHEKRNCYMPVISYRSDACAEVWRETDQ